MNKFTLAALALMASFGASAFEVNGIYYEFNGENADVATSVRIVTPPNGQYSGSVELVPTVTYGGKTYDVDLNTSSSAFMNSEVSDLTIGEGWTFDSQQQPRILFSNDVDLAKITFKSGKTVTDEDYLYIVPNLLTSGQAPAVYTNVREISEDKTEVEIVNFNVYGPDGKKLTPFLGAEGKDLSDPENRLYANENGIFELGKNFYYNDNYMGVLKVSTYYVVLYYVEFDGKYFMIRTQPAPSQTGQYATVDGIKYAISGDYAMVAGVADDNKKSDIVLQSTVTYNGASYTVNQISNRAFEYSDITSIVFPSTITYVGMGAFWESSKLTSVDMSACSDINFQGGYIFEDCTSLKNVKLPSKQSNLSSYMFLNCSSLTELELPQSVTSLSPCVFEGTGLNTIALNEGMLISTTFNNTPNLLAIEKVESVDVDTYRFTINSHITDRAGNVLPLACVLTASGQYGSYVTFYYPDVNGVFTIPRNLGTTEWYPGNERDNNTVTVIYDPRGSYLPVAEENPARLYSVFANINIEEWAGIEGVIVEQNERIEYYNLQGLRIENPSNGIFIRRQGNKVSKVFIK